MPIVKAQCENCNGALEVDSSKRLAICPHCNTPYIVQEAINYYHMSIGHLHADNVNVYNRESKEDMLRRANVFFKLEQFSQAEKVYKGVIEAYPEEPAGWWGVYKSAMHNASLYEMDTTYERYAKVAMKLYDYSEEYQQLWDTRYAQCGAEFKGEPWTVLSDTEQELMCTNVAEISDNSYFKKMKVKIEESYYNAFVNGKASFLHLSGDNSILERRTKMDLPVLQRIMTVGQKNAQLLYTDVAEYWYKDYRKIDYLEEWVQYDSPRYGNIAFANVDEIIRKTNMEESSQDVLSNDFDWKRKYKIIFVLGKTLIVEYITYDSNHQPVKGYRILHTKECLTPEKIGEMEVEHWKKQNRCSYCGGPISRFFFSYTCDRCGKKKNY